MSVDTPQGNLNEFSKSESCDLDKMSLTAKENEMDGKSECLEEPGLLSSAETLTTTQSPTDEDWEEQCELNSDQMKILLLKTSLLNGYSIDEDVKKAIESGNIEEYCKDLVPKLTECAQNRGAKVIKVVVRLKDQAFALVREERQRKKRGKSKHGNTGQESFRAKLESLPKSSRRLVREALDNSDPELFCNHMGNEIHKTVLAMHAQAKVDAQRVAGQVSKAAKALQESKLETKSPKVDEGERKLEKRSGEKDIVNSDSSTSSLQADEDETYLEAKDFEPVKNESSTTSSQTGEDETTTVNSEDVEKHMANSESDEDSEKPAIGTDDEHVIPTPPPPPSVKPMYNDKVDEIQENIMELKKYQVNQLRKELSFAIARLTSEVIKSYEQACILQKHGSLPLEKSALDFIEKQETKKTFYIKEISTRVDKILKMLSPQPEMNTELQDLDETVKLLHFLQTSRNYYVDKIAVTTATNAKAGFLFNFLLPLAFFAIVLTLSLNGEWVGLIVFLAVVLICVIKSWQGMNSANKKRVEVFARKKKAEKID